jgi:hypothetical protein
MTPPGDELYGLPLEEFTEARNRLVRKLQDRGEKESASQVRSLRKPSLAAWAVNQLARRHPDELKELMDLRDKLASANASAFRSASADQRKLVAALTDHARSILEEESGHSASRSTIDAIGKTLLAGGTEADRDLILSGRLTRELAPSGFEGLPGLGTALPEEETEGDRGVDARSAQRAEDLSRGAEEAEREAERVQVQADAARREAEGLERSAARARARAEEARAKADDALDNL